MLASDRQEFVELLANVMMFYKQDLTEFALTVWWDSCQGWSMEQVRKAMTAHAKDPEHGQFEPKPADIVRILNGTSTDSALLAWGKVYSAMSSVGAYQSIDFADPAIHCAINDLGGWPAMCRLEIKELPFLQRRFCESYRTYKARGDSDAPMYLVGEFEAKNQLLGKKVAPPVRIGNARLAAVSAIKRVG